jgi:MSHA biogenesis protein MshN
MSLINKMLQDLDARGAGPVRSTDNNLMPAHQSRRAVHVWLAVAAAALAIAIAALTWQLRHGAPLSALPAAVILPKPAMAPTPALTSTPTLALESVSALTPLLAPPQPAAAMPIADKPAANIPLAKSFAVAESVAEKPAAKNAIVPRTSGQSVVASASPQGPKSDGFGGILRESGAMPASIHEVKKQQSSARQSAENAYRRALSMLQEGRISSAINALEQALSSDPGHDAARQTLVGLLLEAKRTDEAIQQLQQTMKQNPNQPALAMALARLQVEVGGPALQTLMRFLPYAVKNADYQAFVAALLQREGRNEEAIEHYEVALRLNPQNGIWWMGLGISLAAQQRQEDAMAAFQRAKMSGSLTAELAAFVDKKLLAR